LIDAPKAAFIAKAAIKVVSLTIWSFDFNYTELLYLH